MGERGTQHAGGRSGVTGIAAAAALYAALTLLVAYPLSLNPASSALPGDPDTDLFMWTLAWDTHAIVSRPLSMFEANIYYPQPDTLAYSENLLGSVPFAAPVLWLTGNPVLALNCVALLSVVLCGVGAYVLARRLGIGPAGALLCGLVFAFSPARFFRIGQLHLTTVQWVPFGLASLHAYLDGGRGRHLKLAAFFFTLQALTSGHGAVFLGIAASGLVLFRVATGEALYRRNLAAIRTRLLQTHAFPLSDEDWQQLESIYFAFFWNGPSLRYSSGPNGRSFPGLGLRLGGGGFGGGGFGGGRFPTYEELIVQTDWDSTPRSYLASEESFQFVKGLETRNLIVPVMGNFAGPKALRSIGRYARERLERVTAFYVSNVEQYLFQDGLFEAFAKNVSTLPVDDRITFIRSVSGRFGYSGSMTWSDGRATALYPIRQFVRDFELGLLQNYYDVNARSK